MRFIEEVVVDEFLPTFRSLLAVSLRERGLTQAEVAELLGISQSAVSKYVHGEVNRNERLLESKPLSDLIDRLADGLESGNVTPAQALVETEVFIRELEHGGLLAQLHEEVEPAVADYEGEFAVHDPDSRFREVERALSDVRRGLRLLENTGGFTTLIPAVGSNLVQAVPDAESIDDVAGVPGRIVDVKGRATVPSEPEFGVSTHVANVLLAARAAGNEALAGINVRYEPGLVERLETEGHVAVEFESEDGLAGPAFADDGTEPNATVLYQTGDVGVEPIAYILGSDAMAVAETVRMLV